MSSQSPSRRTPVPSTHAAAVNADELMERLDGDTGLLSELADLFDATYPDLLRSANAAVSGSDPVAAERAGHALKGTLGNLAATGAAVMAQEFEEFGRSGDFAAAGDVLTLLEREIIIVSASLHSLCKGDAA